MLDRGIYSGITKNKTTGGTTIVSNGISITQFFYRPKSSIMDSETDTSRTLPQSVFTIPTTSANDKLEISVDGIEYSQNRHYIVSNNQIQFLSQVEADSEIIGEIYANSSQAPQPPIQQSITNYSAGTGGILAYKVVYLSSLNTILTASSNNTSHAGKVIGFVTQSKNTNEGIIPQTSGEITNVSWNLIPGSIYFLSTGGEITNIEPTTGFSQKVGIAKNNNTLLIQLGECILL